MSNTYSPVLWNRQKKKYDTFLWLGILFFFILYSGLQLVLKPNISIETLIIRGTALSAFVLLHLILIIGPLCRIDARYLPLLYNRRHMGVSMFVLAAIHGIFCIIQFHTLGDTNAIVSVFISNQNYSSISSFPFQIFGFFALIILFAMAATSHDFWLKNLSPRLWKILHMGVYLAYALIIVHVATGALQYESHFIYWVILVLGFITISSLHLYTGFSEVRKLAKDKESKELDGFYQVCAVDEIDDQCATTVFINDQNIAIFKYDDKISAVHNVCKHQMGPIGEGQIIDGCITCPWHGYQYKPENGQSPPPFKEKLSTYQVKVKNDQVWVDPRPMLEGTHVTPAQIQSK